MSLIGKTSFNEQEPKGSALESSPLVIPENEMGVYKDSQERALPLNKPLNESLISSSGEQKPNASCLLSTF